MVSNITFTTAKFSWTVRSILQTQQYYIAYGLSSSDLSQRSAVISSVNNITLTNQVYSIDLNGLNDSTAYYFRVFAEFGNIVLMSDLGIFRTLDLRKYYLEYCTIFHKYFFLSLHSDICIHSS